MKRAYPTFITPDRTDHLVYVPDIDIYTDGHSVTDAMEMPRDAIGLKRIDLEDGTLPVTSPPPPSYHELGPDKKGGLYDTKART